MYAFLTFYENVSIGRSMFDVGRSSFMRLLLIRCSIHSFRA